MDIPQLMGIAAELGVKVSPDDSLETVVYAILDKAAEEVASPKKKRTRILKKDTSRVYTVNGADGENLDSKSNRKSKTEAPSLFGDLPVAAAPKAEAPAEEPAEAPAPKKRGRKTKAEKEAEALAAQQAEKEAEAQAAQQAAEETDAVPEAAEPEFIPEAEFAAGETSEEVSEEQKNLLMQLYL